MNWTTIGAPAASRNSDGNTSAICSSSLKLSFQTRCAHARARPVRIAVIPGTLERPAFKTYRLIYRIEEESRTVLLLRFWHSHRDEPPAEF